VAVPFLLGFSGANLRMIHARRLKKADSVLFGDLGNNEAAFVQW
jgi:hypothetical protein